MASLKLLLTSAVLLVTCSLMVTSQNINITSPIITDWGLWGSMEHCPLGRSAQAFQLKTERDQFAGDDTALNSIRLFCGDPGRADTAVITGNPQGDYGGWGQVFNCFPGLLTGFQLRSEPNRDWMDDTAANNIRFFCSFNSSNMFLQGDGMSWGDWTEERHCYSGQAICAIQTQVEPPQGDGDDTMLNNVRFECCDRRTTTEDSSSDANNGADADPPIHQFITVADLDISPDQIVSASQQIQQLELAKANVKSHAVRESQQETN